MTDIAIQIRPIDALIPYARNARTHTDAQVAQIAASIDAFGMVGAIVVRDGVIAKGHGTISAIRNLYAAGKRLYPAPGCEQGAEPYPDGTVPVLDVSGWTDAQFRAYVIADNKLALNAGWDDALLAVELSGLADISFDLSLIGFDDDEMQTLQAGLDATLVGNTEPDDVPEPPIVSVTQPGDVWLMGNHRLMCGDSTSIEQVTSLMMNLQADLLVTDPPYNVAYKGGTKDRLSIQNDDMSDAQFFQFLCDCYVAADAVMRPGAAFYIWHADGRGLVFRTASVEVGWEIRQCLIWVKNHFNLGRQDYQWKHEPCLYGWKSGAAHAWYSDRTQTTILEFDHQQVNDEHPTMKPVALIRYLVENSSRAEQTVLDLFGGSGSTLLACEMTGRINRSMEIDPKYCDVIVRRWQDYSGKCATLEADERSFAEISAARQVA